MSDGTPNMGHAVERIDWQARALQMMVERDLAVTKIERLRELGRDAVATFDAWDAELSSYCDMDERDAARLAHVALSRACAS